MEQLPGTCVILTCGLPGSGKSYFCGKLKEFFTAVGLSCGLISFDDFETSKEFWDDASFHLNRQAALAAFNKCLHLSDRLDVIIVDDTMHLKSMRKKITSLTKACRAFNLVLCVQVDLELSEARNSCRSDNSRVSAESLSRIRESFEAPANSIRIDGTSDSTMNEILPFVLAQVLQGAVLFEDMEKKRVLEEAENARLFQSPTVSMMHEADLYMRRAVTLLIKSKSISSYLMDYFSLSQKSVMSLITGMKKACMDRLKLSKSDDYDCYICASACAVDTDDKEQQVIPAPAISDDLSHAAVILPPAIEQVPNVQQPIQLVTCTVGFRLTSVLRTSIIYYLLHHTPTSNHSTTNSNSAGAAGGTNTSKDKDFQDDVHRQIACEVQWLLHSIAVIELG